MRPGRAAPVGAMQLHRCPHLPSDACSQRPVVCPPFLVREEPPARLPASSPRHGCDVLADRQRFPRNASCLSGNSPSPRALPATSIPSKSQVPPPCHLQLSPVPGGLGGKEEERGGRQQGWFWPRQRLSPPSPPEFPAGAAAAGAVLPAPGGRLSTPSSCWSCSWEASAPAPWATSPSSCRAPG